MLTAFVCTMVQNSLILLHFFKGVSMGANEGMGKRVVLYLHCGFLVVLDHSVIVRRGYKTTTDGIVDGTKLPSAISAPHVRGILYCQNTTIYIHDLQFRLNIPLVKLSKSGCHLQTRGTIKGSCRVYIDYSDYSIVRLRLLGVSQCYSNPMNELTLSNNL